MLKTDEQIKNVSCEKCGAFPEPGVVLIKAHTLWLCGDCFHKKNLEWGNKYKKEMLAG